jgi:hypothetical protein
MSIQDDIEAIERALAVGPTAGPWEYREVKGVDGYYYVIDSCGCQFMSNEPWSAWAPGADEAKYITACSPDRIRRLLDEIGLMESQHFEILSELGIARTVTQDLYAKLSKALELLKSCAATIENATEYQANYPGWLRKADEVRDFLKENGHE